MLHNRNSQLLAGAPLNETSGMFITSCFSVANGLVY